LPAIFTLFEVEPRGFEPLTSAVQSQYGSLLEVSRVCKIPANKQNDVLTLSLRFQDIYSGCCTVAAQAQRPFLELVFVWRFACK
jgi:hypothetical protein